MLKYSWRRIHGENRAWCNHGEKVFGRGIMQNTRNKT